MYCGERITRSAVSLPPRRAEASADALSRGGGGGSDGGGDMIEKTKPTAVSVVALVSSGVLQGAMREQEERARVLGYRGRDAAVRAFIRNRSVFVLFFSLRRRATTNGEKNRLLPQTRV